MNKVGISSLLISLIILLVVMTLIILSTSNQFNLFEDKISIFSLGKNVENIDVITNKCNLACHDLDKETYCKSYKLIIDKTTSYEGNCEELSEIDSNRFLINKCSGIIC